MHSSWGHESDPPIKFTDNRLPKGHRPAARAILGCWKLQKNKETGENEDGPSGPRTLLGAGAGGQVFFWGFPMPLGVPGGRAHQLHHCRKQTPKEQTQMSEC